MAAAPHLSDAVPPLPAIPSPSPSPSPQLPPPPAPSAASLTPPRTFYTLLLASATPPHTVQKPPYEYTFDPAHKFVTSPLFRNPFVFAGLRLLVALYILVSIIINLERYTSDDKGEKFLAFFTNLSFIGLCSYFFASGVQTLCYAMRWRRNGAGAGYPLRDTWPRPLQVLHVILYATVITFPFIVTGVYWAILDTSDVFDNARSSWSGVTVHMLNAVFAACELVFSNSPPVPWLALPFTILLLASYLGVAYITNYTQGFYTYEFLDPESSGKFLAAYIVGIAVGQAILFTIVHFIAVLRERIARRYKRVIVLDSELWAEKKNRKNRKNADEEDQDEQDSSTGLGARSGGSGRGGNHADALASVGIEVEEWEPVEHPQPHSRPSRADMDGADWEKAEDGERLSASPKTSPRRKGGRRVSGAGGGSPTKTGGDA